MIAALMALLSAPFIQFLLITAVVTVVVGWLLEWSARDGWDDDFYESQE